MEREVDRGGNIRIIIQPLPNSVCLVASLTIYLEESISIETWFKRSKPHQWLPSQSASGGSLTSGPRPSCCSGWTALHYIQNTWRNTSRALMTKPSVIGQKWSFLLMAHTVNQEQISNKHLSWKWLKM